MNECILKETNNPNYEKFEGTQGLLTIIKVNGNDYFSFVSINKELSFRARIDKRLNDLSNPNCKVRKPVDKLLNDYQKTKNAELLEEARNYLIEHKSDFSADNQERIKFFLS